MSVCPYCQSEHFYPEAYQLTADNWFNRCMECGDFSVYDGVTDQQVAVEEPARSGE